VYTYITWARAPRRSWRLSASLHNNDHTRYSLVQLAAAPVGSYHVLTLLTIRRLLLRVATYVNLQAMKLVGPQLVDTNHGQLLISESAWQTISMPHDARPTWPARTAPQRPAGCSRGHCADTRVLSAVSPSACGAAGCTAAARLFISCSCTLGVRSNRASSRACLDAVRTDIESIVGCAISSACTHAACMRARLTLGPRARRRLASYFWRGCRRRFLLLLK
jgi:hypothetical protein